MNNPNHLRTSRAFTLIELLTVISIIAILMGILLPVIGSIKENARKVDAKSTATQLAGAIRAYYTEYGKYPPLDSTAPTADTSTLDSDPVGNANLLNVLRAIDSGVNADHAANPRKIVFFEGKNVSDPESKKNGISTKADADKGALFDPWGKQFIIVLDTDYNNALDNLKYTDFQGDDLKPRLGVGVYSLGKDGTLGEKADSYYRKDGKFSDDVISWQQ